MLNWVLVAPATSGPSCGVVTFGSSCGSLFGCGVVCPAMLAMVYRLSILVLPTASPTWSDWIVLLPPFLTVPVMVIFCPATGTGGSILTSETTAG